MRKHITSIDTLRFLAAVVVVFEHCKSVFGAALSTPEVTKGLFDAKSAVTFFFVLSGYVLYISIKEFAVTPRSYFAFCLRRIFRLYPLFYFSLLFGLAIVLLLPLSEVPSLMSSEYTSYTIKKDHSNLKQIMLQFSLIFPMVDNTFVNPPMWTLAVEMRIALIFPFIAFLIHFLKPWLGLLGLVVITFISPLLAQLTVPTLNMLPLFYLGAVLAKLTLDIKISNVASLVFFFSGLIIYVSPSWLGREHLGVLGHFYLAGAGSAGLITGTVFNRFINHTLSFPHLAILGSYSYGIYITHFPILLAVGFFTRHSSLGPAACFALTLASTLVLSAVLYHSLEIKFIALGRRLANLVHRPHSAASTAALHSLPPA